MRRYAVFGGERYYPLPGAEGYVDSFFDLDAAKSFAEHLIGEYLVDEENFDAGEYQWTHVFDTEKNEIVSRHGDVPYGSRF